MSKGISKVAEERGLVTTSVLVERLKVTKEAIFYYRDKNIIPFTKVGGRYFYDLDRVLSSLGR